MLLKGRTMGRGCLTQVTKINQLVTESVGARRVCRKMGFPSKCQYILAANAHRKRVKGNEDRDNGKKVKEI